MTIEFLSLRRYFLMMVALKEALNLAGVAKLGGE
jgi:hypothetical protein